MRRNFMRSLMPQVFRKKTERYEQAPEPKHVTTQQRKIGTMTKAQKRRRLAAMRGRKVHRQQLIARSR